MAIPQPRTPMNPKTLLTLFTSLIKKTALLLILAACVRPAFAQDYILKNQSDHFSISKGTTGVSVYGDDIKDSQGNFFLKKYKVDSTYQLAKRRLGPIYNINPTAASSSLYTITGSATTWTFTPTGITTSGGDGSLNNRIEYSSYWTNATFYEKPITFISTAAGAGLGTGIYSLSAGATLSAHINTATGALTLEVYRVGTTTIKATATGTLSISNGDTIRLQPVRSIGNFFITAKNLNTGNVISINYTDPYTSGTVQTSWSAGHPAIMHYGGSQRIINDSYVVNNIVGNDIVWYGNSIGAGLSAGSPLYAAPNIIGANMNDNVNIIAGGSNRTVDFLRLEKEIGLLKPRIVVHGDGINDIINAIPQDTINAHLAAANKWAHDNGIMMVFNDVLPVGPTYGGASNATYQAAIIATNTYKATLPDAISVPTYAAVLNTTTNALDPKYDSGDHLHVNQYGQEDIAVTNIGVLKNMVNISGGAHFSTQGWKYSGSFGGTCCGFVVQNIAQSATSLSGVRVLDNSNALMANLAFSSSLSVTAPNDVNGAGNFQILSTSQKVFIGSQSTKGQLNVLLGGNTGASTRVKFTPGASYFTTKSRYGDTTTVPTASIHIKAGTATANTGPLKFSTGGVVATVPEAGLIEATNTALFYTDTIGGVTTRREIIFDTKTQTLTNKTLTAPLINVTGDAAGDLYYRNSGGVFTRLGIGSTGNILTVAGGLPAWGPAPTPTGFVPYTGATGNVNLGSNNLTATVLNGTNIIATGIVRGGSLSINSDQFQIANDILTNQSEIRNNTPSGSSGIQLLSNGDIFLGNHLYTSPTGITIRGNTIARRSDNAFVLFSSDLTSYVPYTGATANINIGANNISGAGFISIGGDGSHGSMVGKVFNSEDAYVTSGSYGGGTGITIGSNTAGNVFQLAPDGSIKRLTDNKFALFGVSGFVPTDDNNVVHITTPSNIAETMTHELYSTAKIGTTGAGGAATLANNSLYFSGIAAEYGGIVFEKNTDQTKSWSIGAGVEQGIIFHNADGGDNSHNWTYKFNNTTGDWYTSGGGIGANYRTLTTRDLGGVGIGGVALKDSSLQINKNGYDIANKATFRTNLGIDTLAAARVPYTGAHADVNIGAHNLTTTAAAIIGNIQQTNTSILNDFAGNVQFQKSVDIIGNTHLRGVTDINSDEAPGALLRWADGNITNNPQWNAQLISPGLLRFSSTGYGSGSGSISFSPADNGTLTDGNGVSFLKASGTDAGVLKSYVDSLNAAIYADAHTTNGHWTFTNGVTSNTFDSGVQSSGNAHSHMDSGSIFVVSSNNNLLQLYGGFGSNPFLDYQIGGFQGNLHADNITAGRDWQLPDASGTLALTSDLSSYPLDNNVLHLTTPTNVNETITHPFTYTNGITGSNSTGGKAITSNGNIQVNGQIDATGDINARGLLTGAGGFVSGEFHILDGGYLNFEPVDPTSGFSLGTGGNHGFIFHNADGGGNDHNWTYQFNNATGDWYTAGGGIGANYRTLTTRDLGGVGSSGIALKDSSLQINKNGYDIANKATFRTNLGMDALLAGIVPYTGATGNVSINTHAFIAGNAGAQLFADAGIVSLISTNGNIVEMFGGNGGTPTLKYIISGNTGSLNADNITNARTWQLPDNSGTVALTSDLSSYPLDNNVLHLTAPLNVNETISHPVTFNGTTTLHVTNLYGNTTWLPATGTYPTLQASNFGITVATASGAVTIDNSLAFTFATNGFNSKLNWNNATANRSVQFPDGSGTLALTSDLSSYPLDNNVLHLTTPSNVNETVSHPVTFNLGLTVPSGQIISSDGYQAGTGGITINGAGDIRMAGGRIINSGPITIQDRLGGTNTVAFTNSGGEISIVNATHTSGFVTLNNTIYDKDGNVPYLKAGGTGAGALKSYVDSLNAAMYANAHAYNGGNHFATGTNTIDNLVTTNEVNVQSGLEIFGGIRGGNIGIQFDYPSGQQIRYSTNITSGSADDNTWFVGKSGNLISLSSNILHNSLGTAYALISDIPSAPSGGFASKDSTLQAHKNLYDLADKPTARTNLNVYSKSESDGKYLPLTGGTLTNTTGPQFKIAYDGTNFASFTVSSASQLIFAASGGIVMNNNLNAALIRSNSLSNTTSTNNALLALGTTGASMQRNVADANTAFTVNQVNAGSTGLIQDWQFAGTSKAKLDISGTFTPVAIGSATTATTQPAGTNNGTIATMAALQAERTNTATLTNKTLTTPKLTGYTVATLPAGTIGMVAYVTDAVSPTFLGTLTGGGPVVTPVFYNGTAWVAH